MLEHPEIGWMERTGYPSWMQERAAPEMERRKKYDNIEPPIGIRLLAAASSHQRLCEAMLPATAQNGGKDMRLPSG